MNDWQNDTRRAILAANSSGESYRKMAARLGLPPRRASWLCDIARAARHFDTSYMAMYDIARGYTWRDAGGPTAPARGHVVESRPCRHCGLQTDHESGQCVFCRQERRAVAG